jgi:GDPmannose 4,6-dehydratase
MILQQTEPDDYVLATGETHSVREFVERAFDHVGRPIEWRGTGLKEQGIEATTGKVRIEIDPRYFRPTEVDLLIGDPSKAHRKLGWCHRTEFHSLIREMVDADLKPIRAEGTRGNLHDDMPTLASRMSRSAP